MNKRPDQQQNTEPKSDFPMRINKYLAHQNYSTRRGADELIKRKKILINGKLAKLGDKITEADEVTVMQGKHMKKSVYYAYHKPKGIVTHSAQDSDKEIKDLIELQGVFPLGRLDKDSSGLIILTNDGRITSKLLDPDSNNEKEYIVTTKSKLRSSFKDKMESGVNIEGYVTKPCKVDVLNENTFNIILTEGKKHQIRRMCVALFNEVKDIKRIRVSNIRLGKLRPGQYRPIEGKELKTFLDNLNS